MQSKLTLQGMYEYDPTLFDLWELPEWMEKQPLIDAILFRAGEFELLYPALPYMKYQIGAWGARHNRTFTKWNEALEIEFNPLDNYDRHEEYTDERWNNGNTQTLTSSQRSETDNASNAGSSNRTSTKKVSACDSAAYSDKEQVSDQDQNADVESRTVNGSDAGVVNGSNDGHEKIVHGAHLWGNIGVTTSATMLTEFLNVERFNLYEQIADLFVQDFCIMIY